MPKSRINAVASRVRANVPLAAIKLTDPTDQLILSHVFLAVGIVTSDNVVTVLHTDDTVKNVLTVVTTIHGKIQTAKPLLPHGNQNDPIPSVAEHGPHAHSNSGADVKAVFLKRVLDARFSLHHTRNPF